MSLNIKTKNHVDFRLQLYVDGEQKKTDKQVKIVKNQELDNFLSTAKNNEKPNLQSLIQSLVTTQARSSELTATTNFVAASKELAIYQMLDLVRISYHNNIHADVKSLQVKFINGDTSKPYSDSAIIEKQLADICAQYPDVYKVGYELLTGFKYNANPQEAPEEIEGNSLIAKVRDSFQMLVSHREDYSKGLYGVGASIFAIGVTASSKKIKDNLLTKMEDCRSRIMTAGLQLKSSNYSVNGIRNKIIELSDEEQKECVVLALKAAIPRLQLISTINSCQRPSITNENNNARDNQVAMLYDYFISGIETPEISAEIKELRISVLAVCSGYRQSRFSSHSSDKLIQALKGIPLNSQEAQTLSVGKTAPTIALILPSGGFRNELRNELNSVTTISKFSITSADKVTSKPIEEHYPLLQFTFMNRVPMLVNVEKNQHSLVGVNCLIVGDSHANLGKIAVQMGSLGIIGTKNINNLAFMSNKAIVNQDTKLLNLAGLLCNIPPIIKPENSQELLDYIDDCYTFSDDDFSTEIMKKVVDNKCKLNDLLNYLFTQLLIQTTYIISDTDKKILQTFINNTNQSKLIPQTIVILISDVLPQKNIAIEVNAVKEFIANNSIDVVPTKKLLLLGDTLYDRHESSDLAKLLLLNHASANIQETYSNHVAGFVQYLLTGMATIPLNKRNPEPRSIELYIEAFKYFSGQSFKLFIYDEEKKLFMSHAPISTRHFNALCKDCKIAAHLSFSEKVYALNQNFNDIMKQINQQITQYSQDADGDFTSFYKKVLEADLFKDLEKFNSVTWVRLRVNNQNHQVNWANNDVGVTKSPQYHEAVKEHVCGHDTPIGVNSTTAALNKITSLDNDCGKGNSESLFESAMFFDK